MQTESNRAAPRGQASAISALHGCCALHTGVPASGHAPPGISSLHSGQHGSVKHVSVTSLQLLLPWKLPMLACKGPPRPSPCPLDLVHSSGATPTSPRSQNLSSLGLEWVPWCLCASLLHLLQVSLPQLLSGHLIRCPAHLPSFPSLLYFPPKRFFSPNGSLSVPASFKTSAPGGQGHLSVLFTAEPLGPRTLPGAE